MDPNIHDVQSILDAGKALGQPVLAASLAQVILIPQGYKAEAIEKFIEPYLEHPRRIKQKVTCSRADSFIEYVNQFKTDVSRIGVSPLGLVAIIDYHFTGTERAAWCEHRVNYAPSFTPEWLRVTESNKRRMVQTELLEFLEENQNLIISPSGASMLELVGSLEGKSHADYSSAARLQNGQVRLTYNEEITLKGGSTTKESAAEFPSEAIFALPPFEGGPAYKVKARMRYRIENRKLTFFYELVDLHLVIKDAVDTLVKTVEEKTGIKPLYATF